MNQNLIISSIKLTNPAVREFDIRAGFQEALKRINKDGLESKSTLTVSATTGTPESRAAGSSYNYYSDKKCLILPSSVLFAEYMYVLTQKWTPVSMDKILADTAEDYTFAATGTGELYLASALTAGDVVTIYGRHRISNLEQIADYWSEFFEYSALAYYYGKVAKDADNYKMYKQLADDEYMMASGKIGQVLTPPNYKNNLLKA